MSGKCRPSLREKTLKNVAWCNLSQTDKNCIKQVFDKFEEQEAEIERLKLECDIAHKYANKICKTCIYHYNYMCKMNIGQ